MILSGNQPNRRGPFGLFTIVNNREELHNPTEKEENRSHKNSSFEEIDTNYDANKIEVPVGAKTFAMLLLLSGTVAYLVTLGKRRFSGGNNMFIEETIG